MNFPLSAGGHASAGTGSKHARRAISPIIATIILIVITVVAGAFLFTYVSGMMHSGSMAQQVNVQSSSLVVPNGAASTGYLTVTLQNPGTVAVTSVDLAMFDGLPVNETGGGAGVTWIGTISTGGTASGSATVEVNSSTASTATYYSNGTLFIPGKAPGLTGNELVAGQSYPIQLVIQYANGQTQTITTTVTASSS